MNINSEIWGPDAWSFIHYVALGYPTNPSDQDKENYKNFYNNIQNILPCSKCSKNYIRHLKDFPIENSLINNQELFKWTIDIHNEVNKELNKRVYSYQEITNKYNTGNETNQTNQTNQTKQTITIIAIVLFCLIGGIFLFNLFIGF